jgi:hypothetical protein
MSFLVEMDRGRYPADALGAFDAATLDLDARDQVLGAARALMWLSQLAYETANPGKIADILPTWGLTQRALIDNPPGTHLPLRTSCAIVAGGRGATIVAFAGTDPLKLNDWITDFNALPTSAGIQTGFADGVAQVWPRISAAIASRPAAERAVIFTGHSLGGALAIVAAARAVQDPGVQPFAVVTYGNPRPGDAQFAAAYPAALGDATFRFVHGTDLVPTVGPSFLGFRHVGRCLQCPSGGKFDAATPMLPPGNDSPEFFDSLFQSGVVAAQRALAGTLLSPLGDGPLAGFFGTLPQNIRDHIPPSYFAALAPAGAEGPFFDELRREGNHLRGGSADPGR